MTKTRWFALAAVVLFLSAFGAAALSQETAKDPVCGMSVKKDGAKWTHDFKGTTYYFCAESCKTEFAKNPEKYLSAGGEGCACQGECPMMMKDVERKVEMTKDGVVVTMTSKNPETVKMLQDHAAKMIKK
ncbi:MAG: YHS domain-containing protein [Candidatus Aminicenantes bacterium]|nr:YHS domain-containing protein [Candidatus Aminicenantes bacterium]